MNASKDVRLELSRRSFLSAGLAGIAVGALTACNSERKNIAEFKAPNGTDDESWADIRAQFITAPGVVFMNNASISMPPGPVANAAAQAFKTVSQNPIAAKHELNDLIQHSLTPCLARLVGADDSEIVLTRNASEALHIAATGLRLKPGDEVLITTQEHPAGRRPWRFRAQRDGVKVTEVFVPSPISEKQQAIDLISKKITPNTRAIAFCHVTRGGHLYPVRELANIAQKRGITTIVDGAQALGMFKIDLNSLGCDAYAASLHKWMLGPMGTGMLYIREEARDRFQSVFDPISTQDQPNYQPTGTMDLPVKAGLDAALTFVEKIGLEAIGNRNRRLSNYLKTQLSGLAGIKILSGPTPETSAPGSTIFEMDGVDADDAVTILAEKHGSHIDEHKRDGHNAIRISTHFYNTESQIDHVTKALSSLKT